MNEDVCILSSFLGWGDARPTHPWVCPALFPSKHSRDAGHENQQTGPRSEPAYCLFRAAVAQETGTLLLLAQGPTEKHPTVCSPLQPSSG